MSDVILERARQLRRNQTRAELAVWRRLRNRQLGGWKFRRQAPVDPFVVDFRCIEAGLVLEIDGATHWTEAEQAYDRRRTVYLEDKGFVVMRVTNDDVLSDLDMVMHAILAACETALTRRSAG